MSGTPATVAETQEKIHRSKTRIGDTQAGYLEEKIVGSTYINITEDDGAVGKCLVVEVDAAALTSGVVDHKVAVDISDTANYLENKITATSGVAIAKEGTSPKTLAITGAYEAGTGISITGTTTKTINSTITQVVTESTFTGHTTKVPTSEAVADLLKALTITDATDCAGDGDSIMWKTISIPVTNSCVCEGGQSDFTSHYPSTFSNIDMVENEGLTFAERGLGLKLITTESNPSIPGDGFGAAILEAIIDEDCSDNNTIFLDTVVYTKTNGGQYAQTNLRCFAMGLNEGQTIKTSPVSDIKILDAAGLGLIKKASFEIDLGAITAAKFFAIKFFLYSGSVLITPDTDYACMGEFTLLSARVRYPIKTINLRDADIDI